MSGRVVKRAYKYRFYPTPEQAGLLNRISGYFDTENAGPKQQPGSYRSIAAATGADPAQIVFVSDLAAELDAARQAGWHTTRVRRPGEKHCDDAASSHLEVSSLAQLDLTGDQPAAIA